MQPAEFAAKMIQAGESKILMSTKNTLIRSYMAGAIFALAAAFAVTIAVNTGNFLVASLLFPVGICMLWLLGFDLLTDVFILALLAVIAKRSGMTWKGVFRNWAAFGSLCRHRLHRRADPASMDAGQPQPQF